jgi:hypothetical protein
MRFLFVLFLFSFCCFLFSPRAYASSDRAYQDYLYQRDLYRDTYNDFSIAKNEYLKFKTLTSEATVIVKVREMLSQRALLLRAYLLFLQEKLNEATTMSEKDRQLFQSLITNQIAFLENHSKFVESVASIGDATEANDKLQSHYLILATSIRQIILGLTASRLTELGNKYSGIMINAQILLNTAKEDLPMDRQLTLDRWFQRISDKRTLFLEKLEHINAEKITLKGIRMEELHAKFEQTLSLATQAQIDLKEGTSYVKELLNAMRFTD